MKKLILILLLLTGSANAQDKLKNADETVFDRFGNTYKVSDLQAPLIAESDPVTVPPPLQSLV